MFVELQDQFVIDCLEIREESIHGRTDFRFLHLRLELSAGFLQVIETTIALYALPLYRAAQAVGFALRFLVFDRWYVP